MEIAFNAFWGLVFIVFWKPWELVLSITDSTFRCSGLPKRCSDMECVAKIVFFEIVFNAF